MIPVPVAANVDPTVATTPAPRLTFDTRRQGMAALGKVKAGYPGPVGQILHEAISAYLDFGHLVDHASPVPRLIAELTAEET